MLSFNFFNFLFGKDVQGSDDSDLIIGTFGRDRLDGRGGDDLIFGLGGNDRISGGEGEDHLFGGRGKDVIVGNKGDDNMSGGEGNDQLVWNNGDGSDLMDGGEGRDEVQVNFDTDLVNDDLQNKDVAEFSVTEAGIQFARIELNDQTERGLFQLDIRNTEKQETNFGGGDDAAVLRDDVLEQIKLDLDGGDGVDTLDLSQVSAGVNVNLRSGKLDDSKARNFENVIGTEFDDRIQGDNQDNEISGLGGIDTILGRGGDDRLIGGKGDDVVKGGNGDDALVWNNGDGSDLMDGGRGEDLVQVNFDTDLVNDDLQNDDTAAFSVTNTGVQFARIELNDQTERGLFELDIRKTETLETNFGGGSDTAVIIDDVLDQIILDLDGGDGVDLLDFSQAEGAVDVNLATGVIKGASDATGEATDSAVNFEDITGTDFDDVIVGNDGDNVIRGGSGNDIMSGGAGADTFLFFADDVGVDTILDFEVGVDRIEFASSSASVVMDDVMSSLKQVGSDLQFSVSEQQFMVQDVAIADFNAAEFFIM